MLEQILKITDRHIEARKTGRFRSIPIRARRNLKTAIHCGYTFEGLIKKFEVENCSMFDRLLMRYFKVTTGGYRFGVYKGFKKFLSK